MTTVRQPADCSGQKSRCVLDARRSSHLSRGMRLALGVVLLFTVSAAGCASGPKIPDTVVMKVVFEEIYDAPRYLLSVGGWESGAIETDGELFSLESKDDWVVGMNLRLSLVSSYLPKKDSLSGKSLLNWESGSLRLTGVNWDVPLILHIGESVAWVEEGSWAEVTVSPTNLRLSAVNESNIALGQLKQEIYAFENGWDVRERWNGRTYESFCGAKPTFTLKKDGRFSGTLSQWEIYYTSCWLYVQQKYQAELRKIGSSTVASNFQIVADALSEVDDALEELADTYRREGRGFYDVADIEKAWVYLKSAASRVDGEIDSLTLAIATQQGLLRSDTDRLATERRLHRVSGS